MTCSGMSNICFNLNAYVGAECARACGSKFMESTGVRNNQTIVGISAIKYKAIWSILLIDKYFGRFKYPLDSLYSVFKYNNISVVH